jgi:hypothetical protein
VDLHTTAPIGITGKIAAWYRRRAGAVSRPGSFVGWSGGAVRRGGSESSHPGAVLRVLTRS